MTVEVASKVEKVVVVTSTDQTNFVKKVQIGAPIKTVSAGSSSITNLGGVDVSGRTHGSFLMFDSSQQLFTAQTEISAANNKINGGNF
jgi:hypothetical protein|tara:strand:+ start:3455 stop:3718 length:264 start_codon:yes stop_codon:yes gene_type:complete